MYMCIWCFPVVVKVRTARQAGQGRTSQEHLLGLRGDQEAFASSTRPPPAGGRAGWGPPAMTQSVFASQCLRALCPWWDHLVSAHLLRGREAGGPGEATAACIPSLLLCLPPSCQLVHPSPATHQFVHSRTHVRGWGHSGYHLCPWVLGRPTGAKQIQGQSEACCVWRTRGCRSPLIWGLQRLPGISIVL